ncbi:bromodomain-containing protein 8 [Atheta coriaria]|uniref:bromodomain-containing protein 8 n=1 Tax=Dalotia coriaria TaxID=877792 RepID=UPI0031F3DE62
MASIQERLQRKREPLDKWSIREQLCLSFAVAKVGDQNWMSVCRSLKPFGEGRPADWFHQKNCAAQYGALLENIDTPKRKKRSSGVEALESPADIILKKLIQERMLEMKKLMEQEKAEYKKLQEEMTLLRNGSITEEQLDQMCQEIDEEVAQKEKEDIAHAQWLNEREKRKEEIERAWRPTLKMPMTMTQAGQKRKASDSIDSMLHGDNEGEAKPTPETPTKPALSPLLTSLLKSPSHSQNVATSSILHSAITSNQRPVNSSTNPTIASLLSSSASVQVSPGIQQLVSTAIAQEPSQQQSQKDTISELLDNANDFPNLVEDIENTILQVGDGDLPEIKNEEVDVIISDLIENADIVNDPETDLLDGDDIISNLESELEELDNKEKAEKAELEAEKQKQQVQQAKTVDTKPPVKEPEIDPFEFQEDPEFEVKLSRSTSNSVQTVVTSTSNNSEVPVDSPSIESSASEEVTTEPFEEDSSSVGTGVAVEETTKEVVEVKQENPETVGGSVEIVEVVVMDDEDISKDLDKTQIEDIVHSSTITSTSTTKAIDVTADLAIKEEPVETPEKTEDKVPDTEADEVNTESTNKNQTVEVEDLPLEKSSDQSLESSEVLSENELKKETPDPELKVTRDTFTPDYREDIYDENIEVTKIDKTKAKRDYSRTKKKDESDFDILLAVEQAVNANIEEEVDSSSEQEEPKKPAALLKVKTENETSNSPWTEEEPEVEPEQEQEQDTRPNTRRYSTPATPIDSVPNSPASSYFEDDRDYRSWKKSLMLVYSRLSNHKYASLFQKPITNEQVPGYHKLVKRAIDLSTIKKNIESGVTRTTAEFKRDLLLMFNNAIMYNKTNDTVYNMTMDIQQEAVEQIKILLQAQTDTSAPARRETRTSEGPGSKRKRDSESIQMQVKSKKRKDD